MRRIGPMVGTAVALCLIAPLPAQAKAKVVFEDVAGDAGNQEQAVAVPGFDQLGVDLIAGSIERKGKNLIFSIQNAAMPPTGSFPEGARFLWHFGVDNEQFRFTVKSVDVGKPDVVAGSGTERVGQVATSGVFRLETCSEEALPAVLTLLNCNVTEYLEGSFDAAEATFTWTVPMKSIGAKPGSKITGGTGGASDTQCQICWVPHYAERSLTPATVIDGAVQAITYKVPR